MDTQAPLISNDALSDQQWIVLTVLKICSASLSVIGSSTIVFKILRELTLSRSTTAYDRFILGLSSCDVLASITIAVNQFLSPSETSAYLWAFGTPATCQIAGLFNQLFRPWQFWYNCILSYYFLLTVISQVQLKNFVRRFEPWMHLSGIFFPVTAIMGYRHEWYAEQEIDAVCSIENTSVLFYVGVLPTIITYVSLIINNIVIYLVLRKSLRLSDNADGPAVREKRLLREATTIMFLYVGFFVATVTPQFVLGLLEESITYTKDNAGTIYPLLVADSVLLPLQGFFNVFIYIRPAYIRFRAANPNKPLHFVLRQAVFNPEVPQLIYSSDDSAIAERIPANPNRALFNSNFRPLRSSSSNWFSSRLESSNAIDQGPDAP